MRNLVFANKIKIWTSSPQCWRLFFAWLFVSIILRELIGQARWFWQAVALAAGKDVVQACLQTDAMAQQDNHGFDVAACA